MKLKKFLTGVVLWLLWLASVYAIIAPNIIGLTGTSNIAPTNFYLMVQSGTTQNKITAGNFANSISGSFWLTWFLTGYTETDPVRKAASGNYITWNSSWLPFYSQRLYSSTIIDSGTHFALSGNYIDITAYNNLVIDTRNTSIKSLTTGSNYARVRVNQWKSDMTAWWWNVLVETDYTPWNRTWAFISANIGKVYIGYAGSPISGFPTMPALPTSYVEIGAISGIHLNAITYANSWIFDISGNAYLTGWIYWPTGAMWPQGITWISFIWSGTWSPAGPYQINDVVEDRWSSYILVSGNGSTEPIITGHGRNLMAQKGATWATGTVDTWLLASYLPLAGNSETTAMSWNIRMNQWIVIHRTWVNDDEIELGEDAFVRSNSTGDIRWQYSLQNSYVPEILYLSGGVYHTINLNGNGLIYGADYSGSYTDRSLIDKGYADATYLTGVPSFDYLPLAGNSSWTAMSWNIWFTGTTTDSYIFWPLGDIGFHQTDIIDNNIYGEMWIDSYNPYMIYNSWSSITVFLNKNGLQYFADYSWDYIDRSLVDKWYVDSLGFLTWQYRGPMTGWITYGSRVNIWWYDIWYSWYTFVVSWTAAFHNWTILWWFAMNVWLVTAGMYGFHTSGYWVYWVSDSWYWVYGLAQWTWVGWYFKTNISTGYALQVNGAMKFTNTWDYIEMPTALSKRRFAISWENLSIQYYTGGNRVEKWFFNS